MRPLRNTGTFLTLTLSLAIYVTTPIVSGLHLLFAPHYFCAEHGALEHPPESRLDEEAAHEIARGLTPPGVRSSQDSQPQHRHHRCHSLASTERVASVQSDHALAQEHAPLTNGPSFLEVPTVQGLATLDVAPKNSPPQTA